MPKTISTNNVGNQAAATISFLLPVIQFFYQWLPDELSGIFLGRQIFFYVSLITLILSLLIIFWYKTNPWFNLIPPWLNHKQEKYLDYIKNINSQTLTQKQIDKLQIVTAPFSVTPKVIASLAIPAVFLLTIVFVAIGLSNQDIKEISIWIQVFQGSLYSLTVILCTFSATYFYLSLEGQKEWSWTNQTKIQRAIQLAIENNGFSDLPQVNYIESWENGTMFPPVFFVQVKIKGIKYNIMTDQRAEVLRGVFQVKDK